jgi:phosphoribosylglycinamide formyltransferase-1
MEAFLNAERHGALSGRVVRVISNRPEAAGLATASKAEVATTVVDHTSYESREAFDTALVEAVNQDNPDVVVLAGFMRILTPVFIDAFLGKLVNIHPSLLPKYPGLNTHQRAIDNGDKEAGATVHYVTNELDGGPPILQVTVPIETGDDAASLAARILAFEHIIFPEAVNWHLQERLVQEVDGAYLDGNKLSSSGTLWEWQT